jgi:hypothetical protein
VLELAGLRGWRRWIDIPRDVLVHECAALCFLSPTGGAALLPAYLVAFIEGVTDVNSALREGVLFALHRAALAKRAGHVSLLSELGAEQLRAVRECVEFARGMLPPVEVEPELGEILSVLSP